MVEHLGFWGGYVTIILAQMGVWAGHGPLLSWPAQFLNGGAAALGFAVVKTVGALGSFAGTWLIGAPGAACLFAICPGRVIMPVPASSRGSGSAGR